MKESIEFLRKYWLLATFAIGILSAVTTIQFKLQKGPADQPPQVIIIVPEEGGDPAFLGKAPVGSPLDKSDQQHWHSRRILRAHLAVAYARENEVGIVEGFRHIRKVSNEDLESALQAAAAQSGQSGDQVFGKIGDGELLKKFIDFLNSPQGQALIKLLLALLIAA